MANEAEFTTFNITDDQDITPAVTQEASQHFQDALQYYWDQDNKTEWIDSEGKPMGKPSSVSDWRRNNRNEFMGGGGVSNPRYFKLNKIINKYDMFFRAQSDEEIRKALKPPNDMGKFAQQAYAEILKEKNKQDNLLAANEDPDTDYETIESLKKENEEITNKYNEGYDLIEKTKTNMEEMLDKIEKQKEEIERLHKLRKERDEEDSKTTDLFNRASHENQILKKVDKNKAVNKVLEVNKHLIEYSKNQSEEIEKLRDENKLLEKDNDLLEEENKKIKNELDDYKVFKSRFNDFVKNYHK